MSDRPAWTWSDRHGDVHVRFAGRGLADGRAAAVRALVPGGVEASWLRQVHSADVVDAAAGERGPADALVTDHAGLALSIVTADCVPVLMAAGDRLAAVHAGWRGLAAGVLAATVDRLGRPPDVAWIGPAIGPCCYEVSDDVADEVEAASGGVALRRPGAQGRPHLDLLAAAEAQLRRAGARRVVPVRRCTRCHPADLHSFRRDGSAAGRNVAVVWRLRD